MSLLPRSRRTGVGTFRGGVPKKKKKLVVEPFLLDQKKIKNLILKELGERSPFLVPAGSLVKF